MADSNLVWAFKTLRDIAVDVSNYQRRQLDDLDYIKINLPSSMDLLPRPGGLLQSIISGAGGDLTLWELERTFERIADDSRVRGVVLMLRGLQMSAADLQTLRDSIHRLRGRGKRIVTYAQDLDLASYYLASATDEIILQPASTLAPMGLVRQQLYLKDGLQRLGVEADVIATTAYKGAGDMFTRSEPSAESAEMMNWLLDSWYSDIVDGIATDREMTSDAVRQMIDSAPYSDEEALHLGYIDAILNEEGLNEHLSSEHVLSWEDAQKKLVITQPARGDKYVGMLHLEGTIINGESGRSPGGLPVPLLGSTRMGDLTVVKQVRSLLKDENLAALVLVVDSGGGSATASEAMASALDELSRRVPVVVYMHSVAASGGYYISTPADMIMAQPGTITGSIGVVLLKLITNGALRKIDIHPHTYQRGHNATALTSIEEWTPEQRERLGAASARTYERFVNRVSDSRKMKTDEVEEIAGGRVWTGRQALDNRLIDRLGGLYEAVQQARRMAEMPDKSPLKLVREPQKPLSAQLLQAANPLQQVAYWRESLKHIATGKAQFLMPFDIRDE